LLFNSVEISKGQTQSFNVLNAVDSEEHLGHHTLIGYLFQLPTAVRVILDVLQQQDVVHYTVFIPNCFQGPLKALRIRFGVADLGVNYSENGVFESRSYEGGHAFEDDEELVDVVSLSVHFSPSVNHVRLEPSAKERQESVSVSQSFEQRMVAEYSLIHGQERGHFQVERKVIYERLETSLGLLSVEVEMLLDIVV